ncbi:MAG: hypothetical protein FWF84_05305 [Kiritimatiellaeota bacterium]|nr:hypothetical protein [Kiritimatiellota bacterium]
MPLYGKKGHCSGTLWINPATRLLDGGGDWAYLGKAPAGKPPATDDRFAITFSASGAQYDPAAILANAYAGCCFRVVDLADISVDVIHDGKGGITLRANPFAATLSATAKTGVFSGKFNLDLGGAKPVSVSHAGVLVQRGAESFGAGHYLLPVTYKSADPKPVSYPVKRSFPVRILPETSL